MYFKYKSLIIVCCFLTSFSKHFLIETDDNISSSNDGHEDYEDYDLEYEDYEDADYDDLYVEIDPDVASKILRQNT